MADWNAMLYNRFSRERMQPALDLINRLKDESVERIIDIGCGTGISTLPLRNMWAKAEIIGVDHSESMLESARQSNQEITWLKRDCMEPLQDLGKFDLVFSNAVLQWLPDQEGVLRNLGLLLSEQGILAMQLPSFSEMTINDCIGRAVEAYQSEKLVNIDRDLCNCYSPQNYYDILAKYYQDIDLWQTNYYHVMNSHEDILNFCKSTGLRPYLNRLNEVEQEGFLAAVLDEIMVQYQTQRDGKVLFEFKRIFFTARKYLSDICPDNEIVDRTTQVVLQ